MLDALNDRQREAVLCTEGPLIVLAGAGSGKTKMLTSRIAYLIDAMHVPAHQILAVTFTNKAAAEMRSRVEKTLQAAARDGGGNYLGQPDIGTFHSLCVRWLRRELPSTPYTQPFVIYDDSDQLSLVKDVLSKLGVDDKKFSAKSFQAAINRLKCDAVEPKDLQPGPYDLFEKQLQRVYERYQAELFASNAIDFGEILCLAYRLFRDNPEVRARYQARYRYVHVDEYQDTNRVQYLLLSLLCAQNHGGHGNICVVGDEDQSIYKWRGADIRNILDFENDYPRASVVKLEQNYRSTKNIIEAAGHVIRNNRQRKDKTLWTENVQGELIRRIQVPDERAEAEWVIQEAKRVARDDARSFGEFAIFYRTNAQSRQFEDVLRKEKIPYEIIGGLRFYDRKEIKDVLSYFKAIFNPTDSISVKRIINVPARGIGKTTLSKIEEYANARGLTFWDALTRAADPSSGEFSGAVSRKLVSFIGLMEQLRSFQRQHLVTELYHRILDETGYVRELRLEGTEESLARIENLEEFDTLLQEFEEDWRDKTPEPERDAQKPGLLGTFLEQSTLASESSGEPEEGVPAISLMTLHSSKGLEFPVVFLVGMEEGLFPSTRSWEETPEEDIEEERRLCYVGMTRARERLYMTHALVRRLWGDVSYQEPSRFFQEIPDSYLAVADHSYGARAQQFRLGSAREMSYVAPVTPIRPPASAAPRYVRLDDSGEEEADEIIGRRVDHPEYGSGTVIASEGNGGERKVTIEFRGRDRRKFLYRYVASFFEG